MSLLIKEHVLLNATGQKKGLAHADFWIAEECVKCGYLAAR